MGSVYMRMRVRLRLDMESTGEGTWGTGCMLRIKIGQMLQ